MTCPPAEAGGHVEARAAVGAAPTAALTRVRAPRIRMILVSLLPKSEYRWRLDDATHDVLRDRLGCDSQRRVRPLTVHVLDPVANRAATNESLAGAEPDLVIGEDPGALARHDDLVGPLIGALRRDPHSPGLESRSR